METLTTVSVDNARNRSNFKERRLSKELKNRFKSYFLWKYPITRKIKIDLDPQCAYYARVVYKAERRRSFVVRAYAYETLIIRLHEAYSSRGIPPVNNG